MAKWIIAGTVLGGVVLYPEIVNYAGPMAMAKWIVAGSVLAGVALLAVALRVPSGTRTPESRTGLESTSN